MDGRRALVIDDEVHFRYFLRVLLEKAGFAVKMARNGIEALDVLRSWRPDVITLDVMMPELDGFSACREIRKFSQVPVLMISARGEEYDRIHGFELGVDDYVTKPFSPKELMMRVQAILKRSDASSAPRKEILEFEGLKIDFTGRLVYVDGEKINLSPKEYELLFYLVRNRGIALTREKLINDVWGYDFFGDDRTLDTHIKLLRKALGKYSSYIVTLRGVGYRFEA